MMAKEEWVLRFNEKFAIPIRECVLIVLICALFADAFNNGSLFASNLVANSAYMSDHGIWDKENHVWQKCYLQADGNKLVYECQNKTGFSINDPSPYDNTTQITPFVAYR